KSTLIRQVSRARPRVADYPFTTLYPHLGVVRLGEGQSFVIADIPGLVEGAAEGAGLGVRFLRHLSRTRLLLHLVDAGAAAEAAEVERQITLIEAELRGYDQGLEQRERWLVLNKIDLLDEQRLEALRRDLGERRVGGRPLFTISAATGKGCPELMGAVQQWLEGRNQNTQHGEHHDTVQE
ncbi:MAG: 50S ribosome-binding GTPase, partial [Gammaproteobacteria bacterium]